MTIAPLKSETKKKTKNQNKKKKQEKKNNDNSNNQYAGMKRTAIIPNRLIPNDQE